jgi:amino acid transporter
VTQATTERGAVPVNQKLDPPARGLRANALNLGGGIAMALGSAGPTASIALTLAAITAANSFASPITILICFVPMLGIAMAFRGLNRWSVNCGATYEWAGRAISPYFGFLSGWLILLAYYIGTISIVLPIGPYTMDLVGGSQDSTLAQAIIGAAALAIVTGFAIIGIRASARVSWTLIVIEYLVITVLAIVCLVAVFGGNSHSEPFHWSWFSWDTLGGGSGLVAGFLSAVYMFSGWDTAALVNEETQHARVTPGTAVVLSVCVLGFMYAFFTFAFQGAVKPDELQAHGENALSYIAQVLSGSALAKLVVLAVLLSAIGSTLGTIVSGARITFAMGASRVLPPALARTDPRFKTPIVATLVVAVFAFVVLWPYTLGSSSVQDSFDTVVSLTGLLFGLFYAATGIAMGVYYRKLAARSARGLFELAIFPVASAAFLLYVSYKAVGDLGGWGGKSLVSLYILLGIGLAIMLYSRLHERSTYFDQPIEAYEPTDHRVTEQAAAPS